MGIIIGLSWLAFLVIGAFFLRKRALAMFPAIETVKVVYQERWTSGHSRKNWRTRMGGARNSLYIVVTDKEVWIRGMAIFVAFSGFYDLLHKIPIKNITSVEEEGAYLVLSFKTEKGEDRKVAIRSKSPDELKNAINKREFRIKIN